MYSTGLFEKVSAALEAETYPSLQAEIEKSGFEKVLFRYARDPILRELARQYQIRHKYGRKFASLLGKYPGWLFPTGLALQQASHHYTADFKAHAGLPYSTVIDLTGGLGMDTIAFASDTRSVLYLEKNVDIYTYNAFNFSKYLPNVRPIHTDSVSWLYEVADFTPETLLYADPARRDVHGKKIFHPEAYEPNPAEISKIVRKGSSKLLLKVSPVADLGHLHMYIGTPSKTYLLAVHDELKEILLLYNDDNAHHTLETWLCGPEQILLHKANNHIISVELTVQNTPGSYLFLPHPALVKTRADVEMAHRFGWRGFHKDARIYTSEQPDSPAGWRTFKVLKYAHALNQLEIKEAMIVTGKFPDSPETLRKRHKIAESTRYLLVVTKNSQNENLWILAEKLK